VVRKRIGGDFRKYYRFRYDRWYGGVITGDIAGCGLKCRFCWVRRESVLEGREPGDFLKPEEAAESILSLMKEKKINQARLSGGEPTIGRGHLIRLLTILKRRRIQFVLETNGILLGADESYAEDLAPFPFVHVRVSLKGCNAEEFARLTGADSGGFHLQLSALENLRKAGVSAHPAVMVSFSSRESMDRLYHLIWKIDPRMQSEIEREEVTLYPHVLGKLKDARLEPYSANLPDLKKGKMGKGEKGKWGEVKKQETGKKEKGEGEAEEGEGERAKGADGEKRRRRIVR
jgi:uncharacterized Fe-S cluster-containing radical SAM superfamily protein